MKQSSILKISIAFLCAALISPLGLAAITECIDKNSDGEPANGWVDNPAISADGWFVAFCSTATNLAPGDTEDNWDVFVYDRQSGETSRASVSSDGQAANGGSCWWTPALSANGRFVVFVSDADNLVAGDTNAVPDYFVHDRLTKKTTRINVSSTGAQANTDDWNDSAACDPSISGDGRFVVFCSDADNLAVGDENGDGEIDVFLHDRNTGKTTILSGGSSSYIGGCLNTGPDFCGASHPSISADGRFVSFVSTQQLTPEADVGCGCPSKTQVFVRDLQKGTFSLASVDSEGVQQNSEIWETSPISADGRFVAFTANGENWGFDGLEWNVFVKDLKNNILIPIGRGGSPIISPNGRFVAYVNFSGGGGVPYVVLHDIQTNKKTIVGTTPSGKVVESGNPSLNNLYVVFGAAENLIPGDDTCGSVFLYEIFESSNSIISADFNSGTQSFTYHDDIFRNTNRPAYAMGDYTSNGGYGGTGGLHVCVGNVDYNWVLNGMSGGWSKDFYLEKESDLNVSLKYRLITSRYDADECGEALVAIDGKIVMDLAKRCYRGKDTGWQTETFNQVLPRGNHTLTVGAYGNKKTGMLEKTDVYFDDISVTSEGVSTPETNCSDGIDNDGDGATDCDDSDCADSSACNGASIFSVDFDTGEDGFDYEDNMFYDTNHPPYAAGDWNDTSGFSGSGGLHLILGNVDGVDITNGMSGGWSEDFTVGIERIYEVTLKYRMVMNRFDADECAKALVQIDNGDVKVIQQLCYRGKDTGWKTKTFSAWLSDGDHTIKIGGYCNKKTGPLESAHIYFDDISIK